MTSMCLAASKKSSNSRHKASTAPNLPSCTNSFRVICPTSRSTFCTKWQMEMEIQNTLKRYSNGTVNECTLFHDHEHICSKWMKQWNMFLSFWRMAGAKKRVFGLSESGMRGIQEVEEEPWIKSALEAEVLKVNWKWIERESVGCAVYFATEKKSNFRVPYIRTSGRHWQSPPTIQWNRKTLRTLDAWCLGPVQRCRDLKHSLVGI